MSRMLGASHQWGRCWCRDCRPSREVVCCRRAWRKREHREWAAELRSAGEVA